MLVINHILLSLTFSLLPHRFCGEFRLSLPLLLQWSCIGPAVVLHRARSGPASGRSGPASGPQWSCIGPQWSCIGPLVVLHRAAVVLHQAGPDARALGRAASAASAQPRTSAVLSSFLSSPLCHLLLPAYLLQWDVGLGLRCCFPFEEKVAHPFRGSETGARKSDAGCPFPEKYFKAGRCVVFVCF